MSFVGCGPGYPNYDDPTLELTTNNSSGHYVGYGHADYWEEDWMIERHYEMISGGYRGLELIICEYCGQFGMEHRGTASYEEMLQVGEGQVKHFSEYVKLVQGRMDFWQRQIDAKKIRPPNWSQSE